MAAVKTISAKEADKLSNFPNFHKSGSIAGMKKQYYGKDALLVKCGDYIYNVSSDPEIYNQGTASPKLATLKYHIDISLPAISDKTTYDGVEFHPCCIVEVKDDGEMIIEQCEESQADFWSVYLHMEQGGIECIADCDTKEAAVALTVLLETVMLSK
jgi:hypothetical protein